MSEIDLIGQGWAFPIRVNAQGGIAMSRGPERVEDAIWIIVKTSLGERLMRPDFGAGASDFLFSPNSKPNRDGLAVAVRHALVEWEPRIQLEGDGVRIDSVDGPDSLGNEVLVAVSYRLRATNELFNVVVPLFFKEGAR